MSAPTREQVIQWAQQSGCIKTFAGNYHASPLELEHIVAIAYAAGQKSERERLGGITPASVSAAMDGLERAIADLKVVL